MVCTILLCSMINGCGSGANSGQGTVPTDQGQAASASNNGEPVTALPLPIVNEPITLTYWNVLTPAAASIYKTYEETPLYNEIERLTGIKMKFIHPPSGQEDEQFNLMIASNDRPDIIEYNWNNAYPGGPQKAIEDKVIIPLNDLIDNYAPDVKKIFNGEDEIHKTINNLLKTDNGDYYGVCLVYLDDYPLVWHGPILRKDWMDNLKLEMPVTMDDWNTVLKAFKEKKQASAPLSFINSSLSMSSAFIGAYGIGRSFYNEDGKIKYGPIEPGFRDFLATFAKWYSEGLIDPDFATQDAKTYDAKIMGDKVGAFLANIGGGMGRYLDDMKAKNPGFQLAGVQYPVKTEGEACRFSQKDFPVDFICAAISSSNKYPKESMMYLDLGYSDKGRMLFNFGIEGESYNLVDGTPQYTDVINKNPKNLTMSQALAVYTRSTSTGPYIYDNISFKQWINYPEQLKAIDEWRKATPEATRLPSLMAGPDDSKRMASLMNEINTYTDEMFLKFIMGQEQLSQFDEYVSNIKKMGIEEVLKIQQESFDKFNSR